MLEVLKPQRDLTFDVGDFRVDTRELLTDDLAFIFMHFKNDKKAIKDLVKYVDNLPYSLKLDMMFYFGQNKKDYKQLMKIKSFKNINGWRWIGFLLAMISVSILSNANISTQWVGWSFSVIACVMWIYFGLKDKDWPRALMEFMYLVLSMRATYNWLLI